MKLTKKSEYACLALIELSKYYQKSLILINHISKTHNIPKRYLEQIILQLSKAGYIICKRGSNGGCQLLKPPDKINLAEILRIIDGPLAPVNAVSKYFFQNSPLENSPKLIRIMQDIRDYTAKKLENTFFSDLI